MGDPELVEKYGELEGDDTREKAFNLMMMMACRPPYKKEKHTGKKGRYMCCKVKWKNREGKERDDIAFFMYRGMLPEDRMIYSTTKATLGNVISFKGAGFGVGDRLEMSYADVAKYYQDKFKS